MKIKDLIKHLETLDQEKELIIMATDPTDWDYGMVVDEDSITEGNIYPSDDNGLSDHFGHEFVEDEDDDDEDKSYGVECYTIRMGV